MHKGNRNACEQEAEGRGESGPIFAWCSLVTFWLPVLHTDYIVL